MSSVSDLKQQMTELHRKLILAEFADIVVDSLDKLKAHNPAPIPKDRKLSNSDISRYGRQLILTDVGYEGQQRICNASVLIIGAGGLGCPASQYLAGVGIGRIGIIDHDTVEIHNLHRQVLHSEHSVGIPKALSAAHALLERNSNIEIIPYVLPFDSTTAMDIAKHYDIVLDCTDNVVTRYLINDVCVLLNKPLVSASALRFEGQITLYHHKVKDNEYGPCYRCLFKDPPPMEAQGNCSDEGVVGVVTGTLGTIQAMETIKLLLGFPDTLGGKMIYLDAHSSTFRSFKLRLRNKECAVCGDNPTITELIDYEQFCSAKATDQPKMLSILTDPALSISAKEYSSIQSPHLLLDVRVAVQYGICSLPTSKNIPLPDLEKRLEEIKEYSDMGIPIYCMCRRGNASQMAVQELQRLGISKVYNVCGGLNAWRQEVDPGFPEY